MRALTLSSLLASLTSFGLAGLANTGDRSGAPIVAGAAQSVAVRGAVYDSIARRPLAGATVQLSGAGDSVTGRTYSAVTDTTGRFAIANVLPGRYVAGFFHPALDSLGFTLGTRSVVLAGANEVVTLAVPSARTVAGQLCPQGTFGDSLGLLVGYVRDTRSGTPLTGALVTAGWSETVIQRNSVRQREPEVATNADSSGWFGMCALPTEVPLMVRAALGTDTTGYVEVTIEPAGLRHATFLVGGAQPLTLDLADSTSTTADRPRLTIRRGEARVSGVVTNAAGEPVPSARVMIWGASTQATTNDRGAFLLDSLPGGTHTIDVRAIGYIPVRRVVHLSPDNPVWANVSLGERAVALPTVTVRGELIYMRQLAEFERRRRGALGQFVASQEILRRPSGMSALTLLQNVNGVIMRWAPFGAGLVPMMRGHRGAECSPVMFLDGRKAFLSATDIGQMYQVGDIAAVEVYPRVGQIPGEFSEIQQRCGVVVFWTRPPALNIRERR